MSLRAETFERELHVRLGREYRLRRSNLTGTWNIEQQIGAGVWDLPRNDWDDTAIRARDGYALVCSVYSTPFIECARCHWSLRLPELTIGEVVCRHCEAVTGEHISYFGGYFPLCERLLQRLERTSPKRAAQWRAEMNRKNREVRETQERENDTYLEDLLGEWQNRICDTPQVGYGGSIMSHGD